MNWFAVPFGLKLPNVASMSSQDRNVAVDSCTQHPEVDRSGLASRGRASVVDGGGSQPWVVAPARLEETESIGLAVAVPFGSPPYEDPLLRRE